MKESTAFRRYKEMALGVFMVAIAAFYLYGTTLIRVRANLKVSAKLIPEILGVIVLILGVMQIIAGIKYLVVVMEQDKAEGNIPILISATEKGNIKPILMTFATILIYVLTFERLGFVVSSTICMFLQMLILTPKEKSRPQYFFVISFVTALVVYFAFRKGLDLSLPIGHIFEDHLA